MTVTYLSLGSNLGDRELYLKKALHGLEAHGIQILRSASLFETEPKDVHDQPWFLNTVVEADTVLPAREVLKFCLDVEHDNQRLRTVPKAARTLDLDIIFYGTEVVREAGLTIPHPRFSHRKFVLVPLAELAPAFIDPNSGKTILELLGLCEDASKIRLRRRIWFERD